MTESERTAEHTESGTDHLNTSITYAHKCDPGAQNQS